MFLSFPRNVSTGPFYFLVLFLYSLYKVVSEMLVQVKHSSWVFKQVFITKREGGG